LEPGLFFPIAACQMFLIGSLIVVPFNPFKPLVRRVIACGKLSFFSRSTRSPPPPVAPSRDHGSAVPAQFQSLFSPLLFLIAGDLHCAHLHLDQGGHSTKPDSPLGKEDVSSPFSFFFLLPFFWSPIIYRHCRFFFPSFFLSPPRRGPFRSLFSLLTCQ